MDMETMMRLLMNKSALEQVGQQAGISEQDAAAVMQEVLPMLIKGMQGQARDKNTQKGFLDALAAHGQEDTSDVNAFLKKVDTEDGGKIVKHLLGSQEEELAAKAKKKSGIDTKTIIKIMAIVAPLLMAQMGKSAKTSAQKSSSGDMLSIVGGLLDGVDASDVIKIVGALMK